MSGYRYENSQRPQQKPQAQQNVSFDQNGEAQIAVDGFQQVLEMLRIADPAFRESLLKRIAARDRQLANDLRRDLSR
jgi:hypothetical protein